MRKRKGRRAWEVRTLFLDEVIEFLDRDGTFLSFGCRTRLNMKFRVGGEDIQGGT